MFLLYLIPLLFHASALVSAQQVGSFFTAIYINGVPASPSQISCGSMGQPAYCCITGQSCAWDDAGKVACCPSGSNCQGYAYGAGAGGQYQYYSSPTTYYQQPQTTTVYQGNGAVVPIVPVTVATVLTPVAPAPTPTYTYYTTPAAVAEVVTTNVGACQGGYTTLTMANVGAPVRTVGCQVIFNGARRGRGEVGGRGFMMRVFGLVGMALWVV